MTEPTGTSPHPADHEQDVHQKLGHLTRQLHDTLKELGLDEKLKHSADELPDAKNRLTYIARLTGEAAEKVLNRVDQAKTLHEKIDTNTRDILAQMVADPVAAVAKGRVMNFLTDLEKDNLALDQHLTEIMMAQDFHDLTGQVIKRVVSLASSLEEQLVELLILTAPPGSTAATKVASAPAAPAQAEPSAYHLDGPVVNGEGNPDVVTNQSEVDDLLASLGF